MSKMNLFLALNAYQDVNPTNHPSKSVFKWVSETQGIDVEEPRSASIKLNPNETLELFSGEVSISDDNTTTYDLSLKTGTTSTYVLSHNSGTAPAFRNSRISGADATTQVTITKNGTLLIFNSTSGTLFDLINQGVLVGDEVRIGSLFNLLNQGKFKILSRTATSFTIENASGQAEGPITLGASFADQVNIYSSNGVQIGNKLTIDSGFSSVSYGTYEITDVGPDFIEIYSLKTLPEETDVLENLQIYDNAKKFLYIESSQKIAVIVNGSANGDIETINVGTSVKSGVFLKTSTMYSASITNNTQQIAEVFYVSAE